MRNGAKVTFFDTTIESFFYLCTQKDEIMTMKRMNNNWWWHLQLI